MAFIEFLVTPNWLNERIDRPDIKITDSTWIMPGTTPNLSKGYIPAAQYFDIDEIAAPHPCLKHMLPSARRFEQAMDEMAIKATDHIICYDRFGVKSSPRLWWTFRMFGHEKVSVMDGGLPAWIDAGYGVDAIAKEPVAEIGYETSQPLIGVISQAEIIDLLQNKPQIVDARSRGRFEGAEPEPRKGLKSGHIPYSFSLPYLSVVKDGKLKSIGELAEIVGQTGIDLTRPIITTCGSGVTAAVLALVFTQLGASDIRVYDGSWSEWGASEAPIEM